MPPISIDLILHCQWVLPIVPNNQILQHHSVAIDGGRIIEVLPTWEAKQKYNSTETQELSQHILMPGLVNTHCYTSSRLVRGIDNSMQEKQGIETEAKDAENIYSDTKFVTDSINIAIAEMIKTGTTCFAEMGSAGELSVEAACKAGIRNQTNFTLQEKTSAYGKNAEDYLHRGLKLRDNYSNHPLIKVACGIYDIADLEDKTLERLAAYANELDLPIQALCNESLASIEACYKKTGCRPLQRLNSQGLLLPETQLVGMNHLNSDDLSLLASTNNPVVICPEETSSLSSNVGWLDSLVQANINLSLGASRSATNKNLNLMASVKTAAIAIQQIQCCTQSDAAHQALRMATINGAKTLGWNSQIGSIEHGKYADLIAVEIDSIHHQPLYNPAAQLVYSCTSSPITHNWVAGQPLLNAGTLCTLDEQKLIQSAKDWGKKLIN